MGKHVDPTRPEDAPSRASVQYGAHRKPGHPIGGYGQYVPDRPDDVWSGNPDTDRA